MHRVRILVGRPRATMRSTTPVHRLEAVRVNHMEQRQTAIVPRDRQPWPPDDSEESVVGSEYHQRIIDGVRDGLEMAGIAAGASWHVHSQVTIGGFRRLDGSPYTMLPDVFVVPVANPHPESGRPLTFAEVGVPCLAVEVLSDTTFRWDLDDRRGKAWSYAEAGVAEYIAVDYARRYMSESVRALRLVAGRWAPWPISPTGRWESAQLGVSFAFDGLYLRVYDAEGRLQPLSHEVGGLLRKQMSQLEDRDALLQRLRALADAGDLAAVRALLHDSHES